MIRHGSGPFLQSVISLWLCGGIHMVFGYILRGFEWLKPKKGIFCEVFLITKSYVKQILAKKKNCRILSFRFSAGESTTLRTNPEIFSLYRPQEMGRPTLLFVGRESSNLPGSAEKFK